MKITRGWILEVKWKDGALSWIPLKDLKALNPVKIAEYAVSNNIADAPAFKWFVKDVLRKWEQIISEFKTKYWRITHKFGIQVPKTVDEAYKIDQQTGTVLWEKAIEKKMTNVRVAFEFLREETPVHMR